MQQAVREYRYTGEYLPNPSEDIHIGVRRGDARLGQVAIRHTMTGPRHLLRLTFESLDGKTTETLAARSLKQVQEAAPLLMERVCRYGCRLKPNWCEACSQAERHTQGQFRGLQRTSDPPAEEARPGPGPAGGLGPPSKS
jgi:hypothetical protein